MTNTIRSIALAALMAAAGIASAAVATNAPTNASAGVIESLGSATGQGQVVIALDAGGYLTIRSKHPGAYAVGEHVRIDRRAELAGPNAHIHQLVMDSTDYTTCVKSYPVGEYAQVARPVLVAIK